MHPRMVYVHSRLYRASLFAEWVLLTTTLSKDTHAHRVSTAGTERAREVLKRKAQTEGQQFLYQQDSRINLNRGTLQHCPS